MKPDNPLIKSVLNELNKAYHQGIASDSQILPEHKNRQEIKDCIAYCIDRRWIEVGDKVITRAGEHQYYRIKITAPGVDYLSSLT